MDIKWTSTTHLLVDGGEVRSTVNYIFHVGVFGYWEATIRERIHGPARHGVMIFFRGRVFMELTLPREVPVGQVKRHVSDLIHAHNVLKELSRHE